MLVTDWLWLASAIALVKKHKKHSLAQLVSVATTLSPIQTHRVCECPINVGPHIQAQHTPIVTYLRRAWLLVSSSKCSIIDFFD